MSIPANVKGLILDMDGVLWRVDHALLDIPVFFGTLKSIGMPVIFATNNGTRSIQKYVERLASFGAPVEPAQVVNSASATAEYLRKQFPQGGSVYVVGETGVIEALKDHGFEVAGHIGVEEAAAASRNIVAVVAGMDRAITYEKLAKAALLIRAGVPFIGTNPDLTFPTPYGLVPGAGSILAFLEAATGVRPTIIGKPEPYLYQSAIERLGILPEEALAVGDRLDTDILGGQRTGCPTVLVLSGVTTQAEAARWQPQPDLILPNLSDLLPLLIEQVKNR